MADTSSINISAVAAGTVLRVILPNYMGTRVSPKRVLAFQSQLPGVPPQSLPIQKFGRVVGMNRRTFIGVVLENDVPNQTLTLEVIDKTCSKFTQERYRVVIPYGSFMRLYRLVEQARIMTPTQEVKWRRAHPRARYYKEYFHPLDRFVPVELVPNA